MRASLGLAPVHTEPLVPWFEPRIPTIFVVTSAGDVGGSCDPIGFIEIVPGELRALYVMPAHWGTGAAAALHRRVAPLLGDATLTVFRDNPRARRFYERSGWILEGDAEPHDFDGTSVPFVRYRR